LIVRGIGTPERPNLLTIIVPGDHGELIGHWSRDL